MEGSLSQLKASGENLRQLSSIVKDNFAAVRQIAAAVNQQNAGVAQIFTALTDLNALTSETVKRSDSTSTNVEALKGVTARLLDVIKIYRV